MKPPVYGIVDFRVLPEHVNAARRHMRQVERRTRAQAGCIQYHFLQDSANPSVFTGYGIWASGADVERHFERMRSEAVETGNLSAMLDPAQPVSVRTLDRI